MPIKHEQNKPICQNQSQELLKNFNLSFQPLEEGNILFTYDVIFEDSYYFCFKMGLL